MKGLYGLADSGDYLENTFKHHSKTDLKAQNTISDTASFFQHARKELRGLIAANVGDTLATGNSFFEEKH